MIKKFISKVVGRGAAAADKESPGKGKSKKAPAPAKPTDSPAAARKERKAKPAADSASSDLGKKRRSSAGEVTKAGGGKRGKARAAETKRTSRRGGAGSVQPAAKKPGGRRRSPAASPSGRLPDLTPIPPWNPPEDTSRFDRYDLPEQVQRGIKAAGFSTCTTVQAKVLPLSLQGKDIAAQSQTGTGKTAAFLITAFSRLLWRGPTEGRGPRALIISPTRELTVQIENDAKILGKDTGFSISVAFGGVDYDKQRQALLKGTDLLIGTPGRIIDYLKQGVWKPEGVEILVIDEADRMLDMGFIRDLRFILRRLPHYDRRQSMLFSATMNWRVVELTYEYMNIPEQVSASPEKMTAERAEEVLYHVSLDEKAALLLGLLKSEKWERLLVFSNMKVEAEKVARMMAHHGYAAEAITGNLEQKRRLRVMEEFKSGKLPILVATDVASRGLHVEGVTHVINWDLPQDPEDYVHRIGRTARAGAVGKAISFADEKFVYHLEAIEKLIGYKLPVVWHEEGHLEEVRRGWERRPSSGRPEGRVKKGSTGKKGAGGRPRRPESPGRKRGRR